MLLQNTSCLKIQSKYWKLGKFKFTLTFYILIFLHSWGLCRVLYNMHEVGAFYYRVDISVELCERLGELITYNYIYKKEAYKLYLIIMIIDRVR